MILSFERINEIANKYGSAFYLFDESDFVNNFCELEDTFKSVYSKYQIAYSYKTNYTPYIAKVVKGLGGLAEVVSEMEYEIAKKIGYSADRIIFNGPNKGQAGINALLEGCILNVDGLDELFAICEVAKKHADHLFKIGLRINIDIGQNFISRFGIDESEIETALLMVKNRSNLIVNGLHCHISRCRNVEAWKRRAERMIELAKEYVAADLEYIDLGSGMFGSMESEFAQQFDYVPTYQEYAENVAKVFDDAFPDVESRPLLITEPGTTLINRYIDFYGKIESIKKIKEKTFVVLNCSTHNLGETCTLKQLPMNIIKCGNQQEYCCDADFVGYTCLEQDIMRKDFCGEIAVGDYVRFGNVGGYSNVLKPPFIRENCSMLAMTLEGKVVLIKKAEMFDDLLHTYIF